MSAPPYDKLRLTALRYAVNDEAEQYIATMRVFTDGTAGLLSDLSAREVADRLGSAHGLETNRILFFWVRWEPLSRSGGTSRRGRGPVDGDLVAEPEATLERQLVAAPEAAGVIGVRPDIAW